MKLKKQKNLTRPMLATFFGQQADPRGPPISQANFPGNSKAAQYNLSQKAKNLGNSLGSSFIYQYGY